MCIRDSTCPADQTPGIEVTDSYPATRPDKSRGQEAGHRYSAQPILADWAAFNSVIYIQNIGLSCASVSLDFQSLGDCLYTRRCLIGSLAPGESYAFAASDCVGPVSYTHLDVYKRQHEYLATPIRGHVVPLSTYVYLQNLGTHPAQATVGFHASGSCEPARSCGQLTLLPGVSATVNLADCAPAGAEGGLSIQSDTCLLYTSRCV